MADDVIKLEVSWLKKVWYVDHDGDEWIEKDAGEITAEDIMEVLKAHFAMPHAKHRQELKDGSIIMPREGIC